MFKNVEIKKKRNRLSFIVNNLEEAKKIMDILTFHGTTLVKVENQEIYKINLISNSKITIQIEGIFEKYHPSHLATSRKAMKEGICHD